MGKITTNIGFSNFANLSKQLRISDRIVQETYKLRREMIFEATFIKYQREKLLSL